MRGLIAGEAVRQSSSLVVVLFGAGLAGLVSCAILDFGGSVLRADWD